MKILKNTLLFIIFFMLYSVITHVISNFTTNDGIITFNFFGIADRLIIILIVLLWFLSITYQSFWDFETIRKKVIAIKLFLFCIVIILVTNHFRTLHQKTNQLYHSLKNPRLSIEGDVFVSDEVLGQAAKPNARGYHSYSIEPNISGKVSIYTDKSGFRVSKTHHIPQPPVQSPEMLFFGCSYTWGDFCQAENTYPYLIAKHFNKTYINAGQSAYGLAQMLILAQKLIPEERPKIVFVQYSSWLADRANSMFAHISHGARPYPYFAKKNDSVFIQPPLFKTSIYEKPLQKYKKSTPGFIDWLNFYLEIGIEAIWLDNLKKSYYKTVIDMGFLPKPIKNNQEIERYVYNKIYELCQKYGSDMVIVHLGAKGWVSLNRELFQKTVSPQVYKNVNFIDTDSVLWHQLKKKEDYHKKYSHWAIVNNDSIHIDLHPNPHAHQIISNTIIGALISNHSKTTIIN